MAVPEAIKIRREEGYHTHLVGAHDGGQFMAFIVSPKTRGPVPEDWQKHKKGYAVLHTFDSTGKHRKTDAWFAGTTADGQIEVANKASAKLDEMMASLENVRFCDVTVGLFQVTIDGHVFGLVDASEPDEGYEGLHLEPNGLAFYAPWDATYDT